MSAATVSIPTVIKQHAFGVLTTPQALRLLATTGVSGTAAWRMLRDPVRALDSYDAVIALSRSIVGEMLDTADDTGRRALELIDAYLADTVSAWSTDF